MAKGIRWKKYRIVLIFQTPIQPVYLLAGNSFIRLKLIAILLLNQRVSAMYYKSHVWIYPRYFRYAASSSRISLASSLLSTVCVCDLYTG